MSTNKGGSKAIVEALQRLPQEFTLKQWRTQVSDRKLYSNLIRRLQEKGIIARLGDGRYRKTDDDPVAAYFDPAVFKKWRKPAVQSIDRVKRKYKTRSSTTEAVNRNIPTVRIIPYEGETNLILLGSRIFLGTEIALVPKGGKQ